MSLPATVRSLVIVATCVAPAAAAQGKLGDVELYSGGDLASVNEVAPVLAVWEAIEERCLMNLHDAEVALETWQSQKRIVEEMADGMGWLSTTGSLTPEYFVSVLNARAHDLNGRNATLRHCWAERADVIKRFNARWREGQQVKHAAGETAATDGVAIYNAIVARLEADAAAESRVTAYAARVNAIARAPQ